MKSFEELRKEVYEMESKKVNLKYKPSSARRKIKYSVKIISMSDALNELDKVLKAKAAKKLF